MAQFCAFCGAQMQDESGLCHACGKSQVTGTNQSGAGAQAVMAPAVEKTSAQAALAVAGAPATPPAVQKPAMSLWIALAPVIIAIIIVLIPVPAGLKFSAWAFFAVFCGVIAGTIIEPLPAAAVGFVGVGVATVLGLVDPRPGPSVAWALSGFSNGTVWLIFAAFMFSTGYEKTGLGRRIALGLVKTLGSKTLGLGYAIMLADLVLAPATPSNTARSGGTIFPIIRNIPPLYGSYPGETARKLGSYVMWVALCATSVTAATFATGLATNAFSLEIVRKLAKVEITWTQWFIGFLPMAVILLSVLPYLIYKIYPPEIKSSTEVPVWAGKQLAKMGKISWREIGLALIVGCALIFWIFGTKIVDTTAVALMATGLMVVCRIVTWDDILSNKAAWSVLVWFGTLVSLADGLNRVGFVGWFAKLVASHLTGLSPVMVMAALVALYYVVHYMFANLTSQAVGVLPMLLVAGMSIPGMPVRSFAMLLCFSLALQGVITPYACGAAPIYYASGYISRKDFWLQGAIFGAIFLGTLLAVGIPYLSYINR
jgi:L-tartrate/succinate antiporter